MKCRWLVVIANGTHSRAKVDWVTTSDFANVSSAMANTGMWLWLYTSVYNSSQKWPNGLQRAGEIQRWGLLHSIELAKLYWQSGSFRKVAQRPDPLWCVESTKKWRFCMWPAHSLEVALLAPNLLPNNHTHIGDARVGRLYRDTGPHFGTICHWVPNWPPQVASWQGIAAVRLQWAGSRLPVVSTIVWYITCISFNTNRFLAVDERLVLCGWNDVVLSLTAPSSPRAVLNEPATNAQNNGEPHGLCSKA